MSNLACADVSTVCVGGKQQLALLQQETAEGNSLPDLAANIAGAHTTLQVSLAQMMMVMKLFSGRVGTHTTLQVSLAQMMMVMKLCSGHIGNKILVGPVCPKYLFLLS